MEKYDFYAVIVTYNPNQDVVLDNVKKICQYNGRAIIVDNSTSIEFYDKIVDSVFLISLGKNYGIAYAQNIGIKKALEEGAKVIGFFDQDSFISKNIICTLMENLKNDEVNVVSPLAINNDSKNEYPNYNFTRFGRAKKILSNGNKELYNADIVISSGMFVKSHVFKEVGFFDEEFFIDYVDTEFCYRCKKKNVKIWVNPNVLMPHKIGEEDKKVYGLSINVHSPYRTYYKVRNAFLIRKKKMPFLFCIKQKISAVLKNFTLLFGNPLKKEYRKYYFAGVKDGIKKRGGSYESNHDQGMC